MITSSLWNLVEQLPVEKAQSIRDLYQRCCIPLELRQGCAAVIERHLLDANVLKDTEEDESFCTIIITECKTALETYAPPNGTRANIQNALTILQEYPAKQICQALQKCLAEEQKLVRQASGNETFEEKLNRMAGDLDSKQTYLNQGANALQTVLTNLQLLQRRVAQYQAHINQGSHPDPRRLAEGLTQAQSSTRDQITSLQKIEQGYLTILQTTYAESKDLFAELYGTYLQRFKWSANPALTSEIPKVSKWYTILANAIQAALSAIHQIQHDIRDAAAQSCAPVTQRFTEMLANQELKFRDFRRRLIDNMLVVDDHIKARVIKKDTKIQVGLQFLAGPSLLSQPTPPEVNANILNATQAQTLKQTNHFDTSNKKEMPGVISAKGTYAKENGLCRSVFRNLSINHMNRTTENRNEKKKAMGEKFCIFFEAKVKVDGEEVIVWCCSKPFAYMVHLTQKPEGMATMFWDESFREELRDPFVVREDVTVDELIDALNKFFQQETKTTWNLTLENKQYLKHKVYKMSDIQQGDTINMHKFCVSTLKANARGSVMTFWDWFYNIVELTGAHLKEFWDKGYIVGFIQREISESNLEGHPPKTAMLRFSDSIPGAISISYGDIQYYDALGNQRTRINSLQPETEKGLQLLGIASRMMDMRDQGFATQIFHYDENNIAKLSDIKDVFGASASKPITSSKNKDPTFKPYLNTGIRMVLPGIPMVVPVPQFQQQQPHFADSPGFAMPPSPIGSDISSTATEYGNNSQDYTNGIFTSNDMNEFLQIMDDENMLDLDCEPSTVDFSVLTMGFTDMNMT